MRMKWRTDFWEYFNQAQSESKDSTFWASRYPSLSFLSCCLFVFFFAVCHSVYFYFSIFFVFTCKSRFFQHQSLPQATIFWALLKDSFSDLFLRLGVSCEATTAGSLLKSVTYICISPHADLTPPPPLLLSAPVCQIMSKGVVAVLGPSASPASNSIISNICGEKEVSVCQHLTFRPVAHVKPRLHDSRDGDNAPC